MKNSIINYYIISNLIFCFIYVGINNLYSQVVINDYSYKLRGYNGLGIFCPDSILNNQMTKNKKEYTGYTSDSYFSPIAIFHYLGINYSSMFNNTGTYYILGAKYYYNLLTNSDIINKYYNIDESYLDTLFPNGENDKYYKEQFRMINRFYFSFEYNYIDLNKSQNKLFNVSIGDLDSRIINDIILNSFGLYFVDDIIFQNEPLNYKIGMIYNHYTKNLKQEVLYSNNDLSQLKVDDFSYNTDNNTLNKIINFDDDISFSIGLSKSFNFKYLNLNHISSEYSMVRLEFDIQYQYTISSIEHLLSGSSIRASVNIVFPLPLFSFYPEE